MRILIIDDTEDGRDIAEAMLAAAGYGIIKAVGSATEAYRFLGIDGPATQQPSAIDLILLDVMMPDIDGPTTYQILKQNGNTAHIPVLLLTAKVQGQDRRKLEDLGAAAILSKPFDPLTLADQISEILGWERGGTYKSGPSSAVTLAGD